jgi:hypothetical protein
MNYTIFYKGYEIDVIDARDDYQYVIKKDEKLITESDNGFAVPLEAELQAKLYINRLSARKDGWIIT